MDVSQVLEGAPQTRRQRAPERSRLRTRARLLASGKALFAERGLYGVTTHDIAHRAGVAAGTFYLHFKDKTELFREIAVETMANLRELMDNVNPPGVSLRDGVRPRVAAIIGFAEENRDVVRILFGHDTDAAQIESELLDRFAADIARGRSRSVEEGEMPREIDPNVLSQALVGMVARVVRWWLEDPSRASRETVIESLARIQLSGTHPQPD
jgi:AcrR family transcriptional regulator